MRPMTSSQSKAHNQLTVRPATLQDAEAIWLWRNDPLTRSYSQNTSFIPWEDHVKWFSEVLDDSGRVVCMVMPATSCSNDLADPIAVVRFDRLPVTTAHWLVNLNLRPKSRGFGLGRQCLLAACQALFDLHGVQVLRAEIHPQNIASRRVFADLGFVLAARGKAAGFDLFERPAVPLPKPCDSESPIQ